MALKSTGVQLVAEGSPEYLAVMVSAGKATLALGAATDVAGRQAAAYAQRIDHLNTTIGLQKRQLGILEQQLGETAKAHGTDSIQAQRQQLAIDRLSASITNNQRTADRLTTELHQLGRAEDTAAQKSNKLGEIMTGALRRAGEMAINAMADAARAVGRFIGESLSMAGDYEQAMNVMQAQSGATAEQMAQVSATARALGADLSLPATSAVDAGKAMLELSKGGLSVEQSMAAAKGTLQLAAAAETDVATAANITTGALQAFGLAGSQAGMVADILANAANISRASITDMAQGFQQGAFAFHAAGQGADDLAASLAILSNVGLSGSDAGTALKNALQRLFKPTKEAAGVMRELGFNAYDAQGNMLPMRDLIGSLDTALEGMTQQERNAALGTIFLSDGMKAMIPLLEKGEDGFDKTKAAINRHGTAAELAAAQMKGMKGAAAGLQSQVETLALEALEPLLPLITAVLQKAAEFAGSFVGKVGPAVRDTIGAFVALGEGINNSFLPVLQVVTAATGVYALMTLPSLVASVTTAVGAFAAANAVMLAALGPLALIALAIAGVVITANELQAAIDRVTDKVLAGSYQWQAAVKAIAAYDAASDAAKQGAQEEAAALQDLQTAQRAAIEQYAAHTAAYQQFWVLSGVTTTLLEAERQSINARGEAIVAGTAALNKELALYTEIDGRRESIELMTGAHQSLSGAVQGNAIDYDALAKAIDAATKAGISAIESYVTGAIGFQDQLTEAVKSGNAEQAKAVATNYAEQAAAARASIGEQLIAFTRAQAEMRGANTETTDAIIREIEKTFGITGSISATTMEQMKRDITKAMNSGGEAVSGLGDRLDETTGDAIDLKAKMVALQGKYVAELIENFKAGKLDAEQLRKALEAIPSKVYSEVTIHTRRTESTETGESGGRHGGEREARARGGPVAVGRSYVVGERGPEVFTPSVNGTIVPPATAGQILAGGGVTNNITNSRTYQYSPTYGSAPRAPSTDFATMQAWSG